MKVNDIRTPPRGCAEGPARSERAPGAAGDAPLDRGRLCDTLARLARKHGVPGAQLAVHHAGGTVAVQVGQTEYGTGRAVTEDVAFPVGSISKTFTASLAMILAADDEVELDAPLTVYLPELAEWGGELTLRRVLSHTAGLPSGPDSEDVAHTSLRRYLSEHCHGRNLVLPPGAGFSYSNAGYVVAGRLIEAITGMSWAEAMESILLRPLGVDPAFVIVGAGRGSRPVATGHSVNTTVGRTRPVRQSLAPAEAPAGALAVSALDLVSLGLMHVGQGVPDLLPTISAAEMRRAVPEADPFGLADGWGAGLAVFHDRGVDWVGHDGNGDSTSCNLRVDPVGGWVVALTSNANTGMGLWQDLLGELAQSAVPVGPARVWAPQGSPVAPPQGCAGSYANGDLEYVVRHGEDGGLVLVVDGEIAPLTCYGGKTFTLEDPSTGREVFGGRFTADRSTGRIDGVEINGRFARRSEHTAQRVA